MKDKDQLTDEIIVLTDYFLHRKSLATISGDACMAAATAVILHLDYLAEVDAVADEIADTITKKFLGKGDDDV